MNFDQSIPITQGLFIAEDSCPESIDITRLVVEFMNQPDDTDLRILDALDRTGTLTPVFQALGHLGIEPRELGDRLELLAGRRLIRVEGLGGTFTPGDGPSGRIGWTICNGNGTTKWNPQGGYHRRR